MKDVIVVSYATHRAGLLDEYEQQLKYAQIDFHLEPVELADGINSVTARWKFEYMWRMCSKFRGYQSIVFTDAWDVLFVGGKEDFLRPDWVTFAAERNCWPEPGSPLSDSPWAFVNAGMCSLAIDTAHKWLREMLHRTDIDILEQAWLNRSRATGCDFFLDTTTSVFYTVSADKEDGSLVRLGDGRLFNRQFNSFPRFFHFSGKCPTEPFRDMLRTGKPLCASV